MVACLSGLTGRNATLNVGMEYRSVRGNATIPPQPMVVETAMEKLLREEGVAQGHVVSAFFSFSYFLRKFVYFFTFQLVI